ncbi:PglL family O-oligosaccharyltransferase [Niveibacterium umoris]|uniref:PglL family O-oligosaccharyltransferase n=1 Tax=Niveibacterium umoris TaxID=1193620 RepID=UPI0016171D7E|nr:O-antigen ligase family protein [Niveibacterium umoris]
MAIPTALALRSTPQVMFWVECFTATLVVAAWLTTEARVRVGPLAVLLAVGVGVIAATQVSLAGAMVGLCVYLALFWLANGLVAVDQVRTVRAVLAGLYCCALLQSAIGALQLAGVDLHGLVLAKIYQQAYGNIGQANHYAALLSLGLVAVIGGAKRFHVPRVVLACSVLGFAVFIAASASRAPWFYMIAFMLLGVWALRAPGGDARSAGKLAIATGGTALAVQVLFANSGLLDRLGVTSSIARAADAGSNGQRLYDWSLAVSAIKAHPWLGVGVGGFHGWAVEQMPLTPHVPFSKFAEHAHNLPLHLAATMGLPFAVLFVGLAGWWLIRQLRVPMTPERLFALCGLSVIGLHSMVEYPLWYAYFIIPAGLFCGILSATDPGARTFEVPAWAMKTLGAVFVVGLLWVARDYIIVERAYADWSSRRSQTTDVERARIRAELAGISDWSIVADHARSLELQTWKPVRATAARVAQQCDAAFKARPSWGLGTHCLLAKGMAGDAAGVERMSLVLCEGFPRHHGMLREWAATADEYQPPVSVRSFNCLNSR